MSFLGEIKRRKVFQVAAVYAVIAWLLVQVVDVVGEPFLLPDWFSRAVILLLAIGFPVAVIFAWVFDVTADGVVKDQGTFQSRERRIEYVLIGLMAVSIGWLMYRDIARSPEITSAGAIAVEGEPAQEASPEAMPNSVAVLPFEDMSANPEYAYFAPGMHDEILNQLAKLDSLNVIARTSVMQYAGAARPITEIARELNVETIMEGSVSYAEGRVAIRTQLIDAETGVHLWSESYNREFSDVFGIQADIAMNVANALEAEFSPTEQAQIEQVPTDSPIAYELYLRALSALGTTLELDLRHGYLDRAIALDPEFALAHALKAYSYATTFEGGGAGPGEAVTLAPLARESAEQALALDPEVGMAHSALAILHTNAGNLGEAQTAFERAMELSPQDSLIRSGYTRFLRYIGRLEDALSLSQRSAELGPNDPVNYTQLGFSYWYLRDYGPAAIAFNRGIELRPADPGFHLWLGIVEVSRGRDEEAVTELLAGEQLFGDAISSLRLAQAAFAYSQMDRPDETARFFGMLEEHAREEPVADSVWAMAHFAMGEHDEAYGRLESALSNPLATDQIALAELKANPYGNSLLDEPRWQEIRDRIGQF